MALDVQSLINEKKDWSFPCQLFWNSLYWICIWSSSCTVLVSLFLQISEHGHERNDGCSTKCVGDTRQNATGRPIKISGKLYRLVLSDNYFKQLIWFIGNGQGIHAMEWKNKITTRTMHVSRSQNQGTWKRKICIFIIILNKTYYLLQGWFNLLCEPADLGCSSRAWLYLHPAFSPHSRGPANILARKLSF